MIDRSFSLQPFPSAGLGLNLAITGHIARRGHTLALRYELRGRLTKVALPAPAVLPERRPGLWQETCFEFFLAVQDAPGYWEFNLSPAGPWNVYRFAAYREGMQEEMAFTSLPFRVEPPSDSLRLALKIDVAGIIPADRRLQVALAAVIKLTGGKVTYWALTHPGPHPDFHRRDSFIVAW